jgi:sugar lactone lactonase YvrE
MKTLKKTGMLALASSALLVGQGNNVSVYTLKDIAGVLPPTTAATPNTLFLQVPDAVRADKAGNIYIASTGGHRVWKVDATGKVTVVIGTGVNGGPSFGKAANTQPIGQPSGLLLDDDGNLYVADRGNNRIYKIDPAGVVTLFTGFTGNGRYDGDGRQATQADVNGPRGMAINPVDGNFYFADTGNQRIRRIDMKTGIITTVAGSTASGSATGAAFGGDGGLAVRARLSGPEGVAFDSVGDIFIADTGNRRIRMVDVNGIITTVAGRDLTNKEQGKDANGDPIKNPVTGANYSAASAPFPSSCTLPPGNGNTTRVGSPIQTTSSTSNTVCAVVGDGKDPLQALLDNPSRIVVDSSNNVIFTDRGNARIRMLVARPVPSGTNKFGGFSELTTIVGTGSNANSGDGVNGRFAGISTNTSGLSLDPNGRIFFSDRANNRVRVFDPSTGLVTAFAGAPTFNGDQEALKTMFNGPTGVAVDAAGDIFVSDTGNNLIRKIDTNGTVTTIAGVKGGGGSASAEGVEPLKAVLNQPSGIWVDPAGQVIYFADIGSNRIRRISGNSITTVAGCVFTKLTNSNSLSQTCNFTSDGLPATVVKLNLSGATTQNTKRFAGVAVDSNGVVYFTEPGNQVVRKVQTDGTLVTVAGQAGVAGSGGDGGPAVSMFLSNPTGIAVDDDGLIFVADTANFAAHLISNGIAYPLAGELGSNSNDSETSNNQGGVAVPAWAKRYRAIQGVAVDKKGNVYLADTTNNKLDRIPYAAPAACDPATEKTCPANNRQWVDYRVAGNEGNTGGEFVFNYTAPASATAVASTVQLSFPTGVAVDSKGNVIFTDTANNLLREAFVPAPAK